MVPTVSSRDFNSPMKYLVEDLPFFWLFSDIFTFNWLHSTSLTINGGSYFSNWTILVPDWLRWWMQIDLTSDWLWFFFTSHPAFIVTHFWNFYNFFFIFLAFWFQNCCYCESSQTEGYSLHTDPVYLGSNFVSSHIDYSEGTGHFSSKISLHNFVSISQC